MKKYCALLIVLIMTTVTQAEVGWRVAPLDAAPSYLPNQSIEIQLYSDVLVSSWSINNITDFGAGGIASNNTIDTNLGFGIPGTLENTSNTLISGAATFGIFGFFDSGILYSFDYLIPNVAVPSQIQIGSDLNAPIAPQNNVFLQFSTVEPENTSIQVIPEPTTITLLALGGLTTCRRKA